MMSLEESSPGLIEALYCSEGLRKGTEFHSRDNGCRMRTVKEKNVRCKRCNGGPELKRMKMCRVVVFYSILALTEIQEQKIRLLINAHVDGAYVT